MRIGLFRLESSEVDSHADVAHSTLHRSPYHGGIELVAPGVVGIDDRILLLKSCKVLTADIHGEVTEPAGNLCT